ncbi:membrane protein UL56 [Equid alphaherpesvirus 8]|uniref:Membrane protein UL56 n=1 Tax=Equid alphaherpesvirus 8 TaxID=39637 RepID=I1V8B4_9ALPH|nr:ORF1 gene product [Equid alphaherpesvirus 8]YP_010795041.1 membrane protein UL56 [Equid alphaherpesvirus 8]AFI33136.1 membrane protein UL56 [Equid alphaherpesvirus 8]AUS94654.1 membrane protein UL56 [Equid alphaherpesvirus 8]AUS94734.1 membrane protein UL56 [Equid alphaherpesvirus 8]AUS94814.1 membrane protein UL56 [Equid alphaherpesvirus 8]AUS94894.1 membrane protein UL56 [Equid alphaherpesvirus 8]
MNHEGVSRGRASSVSISMCPPPPSGARRASLGCPPPLSNRPVCCTPSSVSLSSSSSRRSMPSLSSSRSSSLPSTGSLRSITRNPQRLPSRPPSYTAINPECLLERGAERPRAWTASVMNAPPSYSEALCQAPPAYELVPELSYHPTQDPRGVYSSRSNPDRLAHRRQNPICIFIIVVATMLLILGLLLTITLSSLTNGKKDK